MATISEVYEAFKALQIREKLPQLIKKTEYQLVTKIIKQHQFGLLANNQKITPSYASAVYSKFKASLNASPGYGTPDATVTGNYNANLHVEIDGENYSIESDVDYAKSASLAQYDVSNNFNLPSEQSKEEYWDKALLAEIRRYINETIGL